MNHFELFECMAQNRLVSQNWRNTLKLLDSINYSGSNKEDILKMIVLYFSFLDDGNVYMSLDPSVLESKLMKKIEGLKVMNEEEETETLSDFTLLPLEVQTLIAKNIDVTDLKEAFGLDRLFMAENNKLYTRKNYNAVQQIEASVARLFNGVSVTSGSLQYASAMGQGFSLTDGQKEIIKKGIDRNLLITGGPGTGKTTSIFFLLLECLLSDSSYSIYLTAPSGKASARMKDSILSCTDLLEPSFVLGHKDLVEKIKNLENYTIHRLLQYSPINNCFTFHSGNQFPSHSIFVIDEASMIDVSIFAALLNAIPNDAKVFILGDKNQLPSVECGAVFGALLERSSLSDYIVELDVSKRFDNTSEIYQLSETINHGDDLSYLQNQWKDWETFEVQNTVSNGTPIYLYRDEAKNNTKMVKEIAGKWYKAFYSGLQEKCRDISVPNGDDVQTDLSQLDSLWQIAENARILSAVNEGSRGVESINRHILKSFYWGIKKISGYYPGELLIITKNNKHLDLYNGDCGVSVQFAGDDTLYIMVKKGTILTVSEKKEINQIFKLGDYIFYPIQLIDRENISSAFAISIHKSQGSDYNNILVILPRIKENPLLNRQIVYTAITRTKKNTYILSNQENMETARDTVLLRDTL